MAGSKIDDMNEVADSSAIRSVVVVSPNPQLLLFSDRHLRHKRQQVVGNPERVFSDEPAFMCANRIEVSQNANAPIIVRSIKVLQHFLDEKLCSTVRICRPEGMLLVERQITRYPVNSGGRTEDERLYLCLLHGRYETHCSHDVVVVIAHGTD